MYDTYICMCSVATINTIGLLNGWHHFVGCVGKKNGRFLLTMDSLIASLKNDAKSAKTLDMAIFPEQKVVQYSKWGDVGSSRNSKPEDLNMGGYDVPLKKMALPCWILYPKPHVQTRTVFSVAHHQVDAGRLSPRTSCGKNGARQSLWKMVVLAEQLAG